MKLRFYNLFFAVFMILLTGSPFSILAQQDTSSNTVIVIVPTKPSLSDGRKLEILPQVTRTSQTTKPELNIQTVEKFSQTGKHVSTIEPVLHTPERSQIFPNGYVNLGYGNLNAIQGNAYINNHSDPNNAYGFHANHFSTQVPKSIQDFSRNELGMFTKLFKGFDEFGASLDYERHAYRFYNPADSVEGLFTQKELTRNLEQWNLNLYYKAGDLNQVALRPYFRGHGAFERYVFTGNRFENSFNLGGHLRLEHASIFSQNVRETQALDVQLHATADRLYLGENNEMNRYFGWLQVQEEFDFDFMGRKIDAKVGIKSAAYTDTGDFEMYFNLIFHIDAPLMGEDLILYAGLDGGYERRSLQTLYSVNPFINNNPLLQNQFNNYKAYGGIMAKIAPGTSFQLEASSTSITDFALFTASFDPLRRFEIVYENLIHNTVKGQLNFNLGEKAWINLIGSYHNYITQSEREAWLMPDYEVKLRTRYQMANQLFARLDLISMGTRFAIDENRATQKLPPLLDLNLGVDFAAGEHFYVFTEVNNLVNARYQRWYQYPVYGFNATAGIGYRF